jgi:hypothetical protein
LLPCVGRTSAGASRALTAATRNLLGKLSTPTLFLPEIVVGMEESDLYRTAVTGKVDRKRLKEKAAALARTYYETNDAVTRDSDGCDVCNRSGGDNNSGYMQDPAQDGTRCAIEKEVLGIMAPFVTGLQIVSLPVTSAAGPHTVTVSANASASMTTRNPSLLEWSFMALGGDSMNAQVVLWQLSQKFHREFDWTILTDMSIGQLVDLIASTTSNEEVSLVYMHPQCMSSYMC